MAGWMVESAYGYGKAASILCKHQMMDIAEINAALGVEILLKSILAEPDLHLPNTGTVAQSYTTPRIKKPEPKGGPAGHDLYAIYLMIPAHIINSLNLVRHEKALEEKRFTFIKSRYRYESGAQKSYDDTLLHTLGMMIPDFVHYFLEKGCEDPWLEYYKANPQQFSLPTGLALWIK